MADKEIISNVSAKGRITVPADIRRELGIKPGGRVRFIRKGKQVMIEAYEEPPISSLFGLLKVPAGAGIPDLDAAIDSAWDIRAKEIVRKGNR